MEALRKTREMRQKYEHLVDDSDNQVGPSAQPHTQLINQYFRGFQIYRKSKFAFAGHRYNSAASTAQPVVAVSISAVSEK